MSRAAEIAAAVARVYASIDAQAAAWNACCRACGRCCDFDQYDHRLFVTSAELIHFRASVPDDRRRAMAGGVCPYRIDGKCSVYDSRFAGCRIFCCSGPTEAQSRLSEEALDRFKHICEQYHVPYAYLDLKTALNEAQADLSKG